MELSPQFNNCVFSAYVQKFAFSVHRGFPRRRKHHVANELEKGSTSHLPGIPVECRGICLGEINLETDVPARTSCRQRARASYSHSTSKGAAPEPDTVSHEKGIVYTPTSTANVLGQQQIERNGEETNPLFSITIQMKMEIFQSPKQI